MMTTFLIRMLSVTAGGTAMLWIASVPGQAAPKAKPAAPPAFARCVACHATTPGAAHGVGPNLFGVSGKKAGTRPGYAYSPALQKSGRVWTRAEMIAYIADPAKTVPGTKMINPSVASAADRMAIAQYLEKLK